MKSSLISVVSEIPFCLAALQPFIPRDYVVGEEYNWRRKLLSAAVLFLLIMLQ